MRAFQLHSTTEGSIGRQGADAFGYPPNGFVGRYALFHYPARIRAVTEGRKRKAAQHDFESTSAKAFLRHVIEGVFLSGTLLRILRVK